MNLTEALADLDGRQPERMIPDLDRIRMLAGYLDDPQLRYPTIHVTGTNGKTTTARVITALACAHGLTTGTYTSPHLESITERLAVCGADVTGEEFAREYERLLPYVKQVDRLGPERVTYFEALTALAYVWFADKPVALGVFEVGMGGSWDATNLVAGDVSVLTPIALDHPELGSTVREVAVEKAGVIKEGKPAVVREQPPDAMRAIEERRRDVGATLVLEGKDFDVVDRTPAVGGQSLTVRAPHATYPELVLPLFGEHAARNTAAGLTALELLLGRELHRDTVADALRFVRSPGRLEVVSRRPLVILDGAHNPAGAAALVATLQESFSWLDLYAVLSISANKDVDGIVKEVAPVISKAFVTRNSSPRAAPAETLEKACRESGLDAEAWPTVDQALDAARGQARDGDLVLVTGSLYTVADALRAIESHGH